MNEEKQTGYELVRNAILFEKPDRIPLVMGPDSDMIDNKQPALWMNCPAVDEVRGRMAFSTCLDIQSVMQEIPLMRIPAETFRDRGIQDVFPGR